MEFYTDENNIKDSYDKDYLIDKIKELSLELEKERQKSIASEKELELFLETATDLCGIIVADGDNDFRLKKFNCNWGKTLGWSKEELNNISPLKKIHPDDVEGLKKIFDVLNKKEKSKAFVCRYLCKDGQYKLIEWNWNYEQDNDSIIITGKDITVEKKLQEEKKNLQEAVNLESLKTEFFANMSHEFKTPLNIIISTVKLIDINFESWSIEEQKKNIKKYIKGIKQNSYRLLRFANNLIDMTKIDGGYYELRSSNCNIVNVIEEIIFSVAEYIDNKGRNLIFDTEEEEIILACDPEKIERIMFNLLSNSLKYTSENGNIEVNLKVDRENQKVIVSVKDDGIGIPKDYAKVVFERFRQVENLSRKFEGSGIGLSLVKSLVEMHEGHIWIRENVEKGTEILFDLPIKKVNEQSNNRLYAKEIDSKTEKCNVEFSDIYTA